LVGIDRWPSREHDAGLEEFVEAGAKIEISVSRYDFPVLGFGHTRRLNSIQESSRFNSKEGPFRLLSIVASPC
jgi:hypothetical protein